MKVWGLWEKVPARELTWFIFIWFSEFFLHFQELHSSVRTNNVETCLRLLSKGADPNYFHLVCTWQVYFKTIWRCTAGLRRSNSQWRVASLSLSSSKGHGFASKIPTDDDAMVLIGDWMVLIGDWVDYLFRTEDRLRAGTPATQHRLDTTNKHGLKWHYLI